MFFSLSHAIHSLAKSIDRLAAAISREPSMAERAGPVSVAISIEPETTGNGGPMQEFACNDAERLAIAGFTPSVVDQGGIAFTNPDGSPLDPASLAVSWSTDHPEIAALSFDPDGRNGKVGSTAPGRAIVTAAIGPYPDGSMASWSFGLTIGMSAPGEPTVNVTVEAES